MRLIHTADVHLDAPNQALGERATAQRQRVRDALVRIVDLCLERGVQGLVVAGDLFDSRRPPQRAVDFASAQLRRLTHASPPIHVFLLPGTHDSYAEDSIYGGSPAGGLPGHQHILGGPDPLTVMVPGLGLAVHAQAHLCDHTGQQPLRHLRPSPDAAINVGIAHGSAERGDIENDSSLFAAAEIEATRMDYLALGHWHGYHDHSAGGVTAINPGSPEVLGFGEREPGVVVEVTLGEGPARVEPLPVGSLRSQALMLNAGEVSGTEDVIQRITEMADPDLLLDVIVSGLAAPGVVVNADEVHEATAGGFFALRIRDQSHPALDDLSEADTPEVLALGRFIRIAREYIEAADNEQDRRVAERALHLGVALLRGREVL
ncbi:MAG TPA: DNA repair exonuclease [Armatimonadota bacterium]|nr:DNA repair exonuclease [Armatimonadota bacterium]